MDTSLSAIAGIFILAVLVEGVVEWLLGAWTFEGPWRFGKAYIAALMAVVVCLAYGADLPAALGLPRVPWAGEVMTGLTIGRGSNYLNVLVKRLSVVSAPSQSVASVPTPEDGP